MGTDISPSDLVTLSEIATLQGVAIVTARTWPRRYPDFPAPWRKGSAGEPNLYLRADIVAWLQQTGRLA